MRRLIRFHWVNEQVVEGRGRRARLALEEVRPSRSRRGRGQRPVAPDTGRAADGRSDAGRVEGAVDQRSRRDASPRRCFGDVVIGRAGRPGPTRDLDSIAEGLGSRYKLLMVGFHMYPLHGANQPVIDLMAEMKHEHRIDAANIEALEGRTNYLETMYPSPKSSRATEGAPGESSTPYYVAHAKANSGYRQVCGRTYGPDGVSLYDDAEEARFMVRVTVVDEHGRPMCSAAIVARTQNGATHCGEYPYERMQWNDHSTGRDT